jgi:hypothetical protein
VREFRSWKPSGWLLFSSYVAGFLICYSSLVLVLRQKGPVIYANLLFGLLLPLREWFRQFGSTASTSSSGSLFMSAVLGGLLFVAIVSLFRYEQKFVRWLAFLLGAVLIIMCVWWGRLPNI